MQYSIEKYDQYGFIKPPIWLWLGWMLLAKAWIVFIGAGVSREHGSRILDIIYPDSDLLYSGLAIGLPSILMMWLMGLRSADRMRINGIMSFGRIYSLLLTVILLGQTVYSVYLSRGKFSWEVGVILLFLSWFLLYLLRSKTVKACFKVPHILYEEKLKQEQKEK
ncbi:DUF2919 domain-containing protein [Vibrio sp.]|nr:DUF2919 domain-containing protein [Vibrio sp.]